MIAYSSNCLISPVWLASIVEVDSTINATFLVTENKLHGHQHYEMPYYLIMPTGRGVIVVSSQDEVALQS